LHHWGNNKGLAPGLHQSYTFFACLRPGGLFKKIGEEIKTGHGNRKLILQPFHALLNSMGKNLKWLIQQKGIPNPGTNGNDVCAKSRLTAQNFTSVLKIIFKSAAKTFFPDVL